jgi:ribonuclease R
MPKNNKKKGKPLKKLSATQLQKELLKFFRRHPRKRYNPRQLAKKLQVANNKDSMQHALGQLVEQNQLTPLEDYKYQLKKRSGPPPSVSKQYEGTVDMTQSGAAYIICDGLEEDVRVSANKLNTALNGDKVLIRAWTPRGRKRMEGEVLKVLERATKNYLGTYWKYETYGLVAPHGNIPLDILVQDEDAKGARDGDKVVVNITGWTGGKVQQPKGVVTTVLGPAGSNEIEMKSILINNGFDLEFPKEVLREVDQLPGHISEEEVARRRDMRQTTTFTIDPLTAKDFDDALSVRWLDNGHLEIGIHIADVAHYVREKSALDKEAYERSTSVYLVDRVLPMLPERLSNELCSLRPNEDKLTFSTVVTFDKDGRLQKRWIGRTVTHSDRRFTYEEAQQIMEAGIGPYVQELRELNKLAKMLRKRRFRNGSINFETDEVQFRLDENGVPVEIYRKQRKDAHLLVEEFMLLANRVVAEFIDRKAEKDGKREIPFVYRIHDEPDPDKVEELARFAREFGVEIKTDTPKQIAQSYNRMMKAAEKDPHLKLLAPIAIRTMAKAEYSTENIGHYGLGFAHYTHFTSPIRRYSDVLAHRILYPNLQSGKSYRVNKVPLEEQCKHISQMERRAMDAERESVKYKQVEFMSRHIGEEFDGIISGIIERGFFVEIQASLSEGMVPFDSLKDRYEMQPGGLSFKGMRSGKVYKMGGDVRVRVLRTDLTKRQIDLELVGE